MTLIISWPTTFSGETWNANSTFLKFRGHYAVFYMAFGILFFDIVLRFAMIERKMAERWIPDLNNLNYGTIQTFEPLISPVSLENEPLSRTNTGKSGATFDTKNFTELPSNHDDLNMISLLTSSRILMALWTYFVSSVFMTGLESVCGSIPPIVLANHNWLGSITVHYG